MNISGQNLVRCDFFPTICDHIYWDDLQPFANTNFKAGNVIFCKTDQVLRLFEFLRLTRKRVILVTGESDCPCDFFRQQFLPYNIERWFAPNVTHPHPRVTALPLGLGGMGDSVTLNLAQPQRLQKSSFPRDQWLYINFRPETNPMVRQKIYDSFKVRAQQESWMTFESPQSHGSNEGFLTQLRNHRFVLAPPGNGVDTHRLWEALALGAYPIALRSSVLKPFESLPILFVEHYDEVTLDFLKENLLKIQAKQQNLFMLQIDFWTKKINDAKRSLEGKEQLTWRKWLEESFIYGLSMIRRSVVKGV